MIKLTYLNGGSVGGGGVNIIEYIACQQLSNLYNIINWEHDHQDIIHNTHSSKHHNTDVYYYCVLFISSEKNTRYRLEAKKRNLRN